MKNHPNELYPDRKMREICILASGWKRESFLTTDEEFYWRAEQKGKYKILETLGIKKLANISNSKSKVLTL